MTNQLLAAVSNLGRLNGIGNLGQVGTNLSTISSFTNIVSNIVGVLTVSAGLWFLFQIITGAITWLSAGSDKQAVENARKKISNSIVGLFIVVGALAFVGLIGLIFGLDILDLTNQIGALAP